MFKLTASLVILITVPAFSAQKLECGGSRSDLVFESLSTDDLKSDYEKRNQDNSWWKLYKNSFPKRVRAKPSEIINYHPVGTGFALQVRTESQIVGLAYFYRLEDVPFSYVTYAAVASNWQRHGVFHQIVDCIQSESAKMFGNTNHPFQGIVWELDRPDLVNDPVQKADRQQRIDLAVAKQGVILSTEYFVPPLSDKIPAEPMYLMLLRRDPDVLATIELAQKVTLAIHRQLFPEYWAKKMNGSAPENASK